MQNNYFLVTSAACLLCVSAAYSESSDERSKSDSTVGVFFRVTVSPISDEYHGQWALALTEYPDGRVAAVWEAGKSETKTENAILISNSGDGGRTWGEPSVFRRRPGFRCSPCGFFSIDGVVHSIHVEIDLELYTKGLRGGATEKKYYCFVYHRVSTDSGRTWSEPREIWRSFYGAAMQPAVLSDDRIILPVYYLPAGSVTQPTPCVSQVLVSNDSGLSWKVGGEIQADTPRGAMEPAVAEIGPNKWLCFLRTVGTARLYETRSNDGGLTWTKPKPSVLSSPEAICRLLRLQDGSLLVVWNDVASTRQAPRNPLSAARSFDGGRTWPQRRELIRVSGGAILSNHGVVQLRNGQILVACQHFHRDPQRAPQRSGLDSVDLVGFDLKWLAGGRQ